MLLKYLTKISILFSLNNFSRLIDVLFVVMNYIHPPASWSNFSPKVTLLYVEIRALEQEHTASLISGILGKFSRGREQ